MHVFFSEATPRFIATVLVATLAARGVVASTGVGISVLEVGAMVGTSIVWVIQEWFLHDKLLHSDFEWFGKDIHGFHHDLPYYHR